MAQRGNPRWRKRKEGIRSNCRRLSQCESKNELHQFYFHGNEGT